MPLSVLVTSNILPAAGVVVLIPTWAKVELVAKTIAKAIMTKHFESNNYRMFFLSKITSIKINGVNMVINN
jgi:hypothetical protein